MANTLSIKFWGVRGSHPVSGANIVQFGGNTPCVEISAGGQTILLDAGTGIIGAGRDLLHRSRQAGKPVQAALFFSHLHHDHTQGFPFFSPAFVPTTRLNLFGPGIYDQTLEDMLNKVMTPPAFPVRLQDQAAVKSFYTVSEGKDVILSGSKVLICDPADSAAETKPGAVRVRLLHSHAHPGGVVNYRIEWGGLSVVYATDTEGYVNIDRRLAAFAQGANLLIHDAQYSEEHYCGRLPGWPTTQGWGHSTASMAAGVAQAAKVGQLVLFHHDPNYEDEAVRANEVTARQIFAHTQAAYEGLEIQLSTPVGPLVPSRTGRERHPAQNKPRAAVQAAAEGR